MTEDNRKSCGVFGRDDVIRHVNTQMINWHGPTGTVLTVDIQLNSVSGPVRAATGGADSKVQVWELQEDDEGVGYVQHLSELSRHDCAVNAVRFHPSDDLLATASDDRCLFIWKLESESDIPDIFATSDSLNDGEKQRENRETWNVVKQLRGHGSEVYDIAWSPDAKFIVSGTMDNASYVWDINTTRKAAILQHHKAYVQGVAWDPSNKYITTVSSDRSAIVYNTKKYDLVHRISRVKNSLGKVNREDAASKNLRMFLDTSMVDTFFRRPGFSPDGKLIAYPCGCHELETEDTGISVGGNPVSDEQMVQINVVYIFQHNNLENPVLCLPTGKSPAIAVRFCPQIFKLRESSTSLFRLPYRMLYAVATLDNILLYDTQQRAPFACINSIHYEQLTDIAWSKDGRYLIVSSIDGFCTIVTLDVDNLGQLYREIDASQCRTVTKTGTMKTTTNTISNTDSMIITNTDTITTTADTVAMATADTFNSVAMDTVDSAANSNTNTISEKEELEAC